MRKDLELYVSAYNDNGIWRVPLTGPPVRHVTETQPIGGVTADRSGTRYYTLQDSGAIRRATSTREPLGQVLALRPSGKIELFASGLNFDWPRGYDGDIVVSQATAQSASAPVDDAGHARGTLDAPATPGSYGIRALVTDPRTGAISEARGTVVVR